MQDRFKTFTVLISKISSNIRKIKTEETARLNLKSPHVSCLYHLYKAKTLTSKELSELCDEDKAAISRSIDFLEKNGYISCSSNAKKRYKASLILTQKGEEVAKILSEKIDKTLAQASESLSEENRTVLYKSLLLISDNLQKICNNLENKNGN